jgi:cytochrome c553
MRLRSLIFIAQAIGPLALLNAWAADTGESIVVQGVPGKVVACATCHGPRGEGGGEGLYPRLAGLPAAYTEAQLKAFRDGGRSSPLMSPMVTGLSDADFSAVATYLERQQPPFAAAP